VNDRPADYVLFDPIHQLYAAQAEADTSGHYEKHAKFNQSFINAVIKGDRGELIVQVPGLCDFTVSIVYAVKETNSVGVYFVESPHDPRGTHAYTASRGITGITRLWLPCVDTIQAACTWDMEYVINYEHTHSTSIKVISCGDLVESVLGHCPYSQRVERPSTPRHLPLPSINARASLVDWLCCRAL
jgi:hypothetical protein